MESSNKARFGKNGITSSHIGSHSLQAGGAMALAFAGADYDDIKKMGRWSSDAFRYTFTIRLLNTLKDGRIRYQFQDNILI